VPTQLRKSRQVKVSKRRTRTRKPDIPPELQAPITGEIERQLKQLVVEFGEKKVLEALGSARYEM